MKQAIKYIILILILSLPALSQNKQLAGQRFKLADSYLKMGKIDDAEEILLELANEDISNKEYFDKYVEVMKAQSKFTELLEFSEKRLDIFPEPETYNLLAELSWKTGETGPANDYWESALEKFGENRIVYDVISQTQIAMQLFDKAVNTLMTGRGELDNINLFSDELSKLFISIGDFRQGFREILKNLELTRNLALAQGRTYALMASVESIDYIQQVLERETADQEGNLLLNELFAWFLRETRRFDRALDIFVRLDSMKNSQGREILNFAYTSARDGNYDVASRAYRIVIDRGKSTPYAPSALYGFTRTLEMQIAEKKSFTKSQLADIISGYRQIVEEYPKSNNAAQSLYRLASMYLHQMDESDRAIELLRELAQDYPVYDIAGDGAILLGEAYLFKKELDNASKAFEMASTNNRFKEEIKNRAKFMLAEITFYRGEFEDALKQYEDILATPETDVANDALKRQFTLNTNENMDKALKLYATAELHNFINDKEGAVEKYSEAGKAAPGTALQERCLIETSKIEYERENFIASAKMLDDYIAAQNEPIHADEIYLWLGKSQMKLNKSNYAIENLTKILARYPDSIHLNEARDLIKELRTKKI